MPHLRFVHDIERRCFTYIEADRRVTIAMAGHTLLVEFESYRADTGWRTELLDPVRVKTIRDDFPEFSPLCIGNVIQEVVYEVFQEGRWRLGLEQKS